jgi:predicted Zn-dependent protease
VGSKEDCGAGFYQHLATILLQAGDPELATQCLARALASESDDPELHYLMGVALSLQDRWEAAADSLQRATSLAPAHPEAQDLLAEVRDMVGTADAPTFVPGC